MNLTGAPKTDMDVIDFSNIASGQLKGLAIVLGKTERGEIGKPYLIGSTQEYRRYLGGLLTTSDFPYLILRALKRKARLYVIPVGHYSDIEDASTLTGVKASGSTGTSGTTTTFTAYSEGDWAHSGKLSVVISAAASGASGKLDISVSLTGYPELSQKIYDVPNAPTADQKIAINAQLQLVKITLWPTGSNTIQTGTVTFTSGTRDAASVVADDYIGSSVAGNGIYAADTIKDAVRIAVPEMADNDIDLALAAYCDERKDMRAILRTPINLTGSVMVEYRNQTDTYTGGTAVDSWRAEMWTGGLKTKDSAGTIISHSEIADILANMSRKDNDKEAWYSASGLQRGVIEDAIDVTYDLGRTSRSLEFDKVYLNGLNAVIREYDDVRQGIVTKMHGNKTLYRTSTSLLTKANIADLMIWLYKFVSPKIKYKQFDPNDPVMWLELYNEINPTLRSTLGKRAYSDYRYIGDQFAPNRDKAVFNTPEDLDAGIYKFRILLKPIGATEFIGVEFGVAGSGVSFEGIVNQ